MGTIAGHTFVERPEGRACENCGRKWIDVAGATKQDIDKPNIAHTGLLNEAELTQIEKERERIWELGRGA